MTDAAEVVVIGAGASGAAATWLLASRGIDVLCLERGDWLDQSASPSLGLDWERALQTRFHPDPNIRRGASDYAVIAADTPIRPALFTGVGGSLLRWGAHAPRLHPSDFRVRSLDGIAQDWPLAYDELEPWYDLNDAMTGMAGLAGDPANPELRAERDPPLPLGRGGERLARAFDALGWHWWPSHAAIATRARDNRAPCNVCGPCGVGCPRGARASGDNTYWPAALKHGARLTTGARVQRILIDRGRVAGVVFRDREDTTRHVAASRIVMAASGLGTPRLLLASGIASGSGLLGRGLMHHPTAIVTGIFDERLDGHAGPFACALHSQEFYESDPERGFVRGYQLQMLRGAGPVATALGGYMSRLAWGRAHHRAFATQFAHGVSLTVTAEDLPEDQNRIDLDPLRVDADGIAPPRLHYRVGENSQRILEHGVARARDVMRAAGAREILVNPLSRAAGFHFLGTARAGSSLSDSVVDGWGRCHDVQGLRIIDGSVFPTVGAVNPTPTIQAFALRAADHLARELRVS
jgi:choline dehydrogenase-like flavoprotein